VRVVPGPLISKRCAQAIAGSLGDDSHP
jgi:hypothetical protein